MSNILSTSKEGPKGPESKEGGWLKNNKGVGWLKGIVAAWIIAAILQGGKLNGFDLKNDVVGKDVGLITQVTNGVVNNEGSYYQKYEKKEGIENTQDTTIITFNPDNPSRIDTVQLTSNPKVIRLTCPGREVSISLDEPLPSGVTGMLDGDDLILTFNNPDTDVLINFHLALVISGSTVIPFERGVVFTQGTTSLNELGKDKNNEKLIGRNVYDLIKWNEYLVYNISGQLVSWWRFIKEGYYIIYNKNNKGHIKVYIDNAWNIKGSSDVTFE